MFYSRITLNASGPFTMHRVSIYDDNNYCVEVRFFWDESEAREVAAYRAAYSYGDYSPRFMVKYRPFLGVWAVWDMQLSRDIWHDTRVIKEFRTEKGARNLCAKLNRANDVAA